MSLALSLRAMPQTLIGRWTRPLFLRSLWLRGGLCYLHQYGPDSHVTPSRPLCIEQSSQLGPCILAPCSTAKHPPHALLLSPDIPLKCPNYKVASDSGPHLCPSYHPIQALMYTPLPETLKSRGPITRWNGPKRGSSLGVPSQARQSQDRPKHPYSSTAYKPPKPQQSNSLPSASSSSHTHTVPSKHPRWHGEEPTHSQAAPPHPGLSAPTVSS